MQMPPRGRWPRRGAGSPREAPSHQEGIALRSVDIDIVWINGYGFPPYRGGPMYFADRIGVGTVYEKIIEFGETLGNEYGYWEPATLLKRLAEKGGSFGEL